MIKTPTLTRILENKYKYVVFIKLGLSTFCVLIETHFRSEIFVAVVVVKDGHGHLSPTPTVIFYNIILQKKTVRCKNILSLPNKFVSDLRTHIFAQKLGHFAQSLCNRRLGVLVAFQWRRGRKRTPSCRNFLDACVTWEKNQFFVEDYYFFLLTTLYPWL